jgi:hypothetical protein
VTTNAASPTAPPSRALAPLLAGQLHRLRQRFLVHGLAVTTAAVAGAVALFFGLDWWLRLPLPIRLFHTALVLALAAGCWWRFVHYPRRRPFGDVDVAVWFERTFPELHQRLVSAVQLQNLGADQLRNQSLPMIERVLADAEAAARALPLERLFDPRPTRRAIAAGAVLLLGLVAVGIAAPATLRAFALRHLGASISYPRNTTLHIELPEASADLQRTDSDGRTDLVLPAGADLHVVVTATGRIPDEVWLDVRVRRGEAEAESRAVAMSPRPGGRFRHVFRRLPGHFEFRARGGDDDAGDRLVVVRTITPPQVGMITAAVTPPAYTRGAPAEQRGGAIEALVGSAVEVVVTTTMPVRSATMVFLESGRRLDLVPGAPQDDSGNATLLRSTFVIAGSDRYQIELLGDNGLRNPNPGTYPISALQDYAPVGRWLLPDDEAALLLPGALLCLRVEGRDDFGLSTIALAVERSGAPPFTRELLADTAGPVTVAMPTELLEVRDLLSGAAAADGLVLQARLLDNRLPEPGTTELPRRIVQIVDEPQLAAAIARAFRGLRQETSLALDIQTDRRERLADLLAGATASEPTAALTGVEVGQGRVASAIDRVHRGLMRAFDVHLWNRLEPGQHASAVVELYRAHSAAMQEPLALDPAFYRDLLARRAAGTLGAMEQCLDPILAMLGLSDQLARSTLPEIQRLLTEAQVARSPAERSDLLRQAVAAQGRSEESLRRLLLRLEEWNDYQDLIQEARALRDSQRDLQSRTEDVRGPR